MGHAGAHMDSDVQIHDAQPLGVSQGVVEQYLVVADIDFGQYERYAEEIPIRKRRMTHDLMISEYIAREYAALAEPIQAKPAAA